MTQVLDADVTPFGLPSQRILPTTPPPISGSWAVTLRSGSTTQAPVAVAEPAYYRVPVRIPHWTWERSETGLTASDLVTGIFGFGSDLNEAIRDLAHALREHRDVLEHQDALSPDLERQLAYLRQLR